MADVLSLGRVYVVLDKRDLETFVSIFTTYDKACKYCRRQRINVNNIIGAPVDTGCLSVVTNEVFFHS